MRPVAFLLVTAALLAASGCAQSGPAESGTASVVPAEEALDRLSALPYLSGYTAATAESGVTLWDESEVVAGYNLWHSGHAPEAYLMAMDGTIVHRWRREFGSVWDGGDGSIGQRYWRRVQLMPDGGLLAMFSGEGLVRLDRESNVVWSWRGDCHHDVTVDPEGRIHLLTRRPRNFAGAQVLDDLVTVLDSDGTLLAEHSVLQALAASEFAPILERARPAGDILHTNTVRWLDGGVADRSPLFRRGNYLISICYLSTVAVLDPDEGRIVWAIQGDESPLSFQGQHDPLLLEDGTMLLFDNLGRAGFTRILEFDPFEESVTWEYTPEGFASYRLGALQRLAGGNTLITDSVGGTAFEVTPAGKTVWRFVNPHVGGDAETFLRRFLEASGSAGSPWDPALTRTLEERLPGPGEPLRATLLDLVRLPPSVRPRPSPPR